MQVHRPELLAAAGKEPAIGSPVRPVADGAKSERRPCLLIVREVRQVQLVQVPSKLLELHVEELADPTASLQGGDNPESPEQSFFFNARRRSSSPRSSLRSRSNSRSFRTRWAGLTVRYSRSGAQLTTL